MAFLRKNENADAKLIVEAFSKRDIFYYTSDQYLYPRILNYTEA